ncbi:MAG: DNA repair protein RadA [Spirochaetes bacterium]|nr:DNA repair protein RadA [Spirochaetota bacterium]
MQKPKKEKTSYLCTECGDSFPKWFGQCPSCKAWNSLSENKFEAASTDAPTERPLITKVMHPTAVMQTGLRQFDSILGGGIMPGAVILIGGEPGIGKSTLLLEVMRHTKATYVTGEESLAQVQARAQRLGLNGNLDIIQGNSVGQLLDYVTKQKALLVLLDSIQTAYTDQRTGFAGSPAQIREVTQRIIEYAKTHQVAFVLAGHITKDGQIAGPKLLEHAVDTVIYFEQNQATRYRFLRAVKNRFGATGDVAIFEMTATGFREVQNADSLLPVQEIGGIGSCLFPQLEGTRVIPLEIQVLVTPTGFANGRRIGENIELSRIHLIAAILEKFCGLKLSQCDIFVRVNGGTAMAEPAGDLALLVAMASSYLEKPLMKRRAVAGQVSLTGEIRSPGGLEERRRALTQWKIPQALWGGLKEGNAAGVAEHYASFIDKDLKLLGD